MSRAKGSAVIAQQGTGLLGEEYVAVQLKAGEKLVHGAGQSTVEGMFHTCGEVVTLAILLCDLGQKVGEEGVLLLRMLLSHILMSFCMPQYHA